MENDFFTKLAFETQPKDLRPGKVLISEPFLNDPNFVRSVILIIQYSKEEGAFGLILNKPLETDMTTIIKSFPQSGFDFHYGGPVGEENLFFIYDSNTALNASEKITNDLSWNGDFEELQERITLGKTSSNNVKFFGGYSGWSPGQLESEMAEKSWIIGELTKDEILTGDPNTLWKKALRPLGRKYSVMAEFPKNPELN
jgi:putative transcriptional regulator